MTPKEQLLFYTIVEEFINVLDAVITGNMENVSPVKQGGIVLSEAIKCCSPATSERITKRIREVLAAEPESESGPEF